nr:immunoglobulin light chain junction region [Macaca mulatta]
CGAGDNSLSAHWVF